MFLLQGKRMSRFGNTQTHRSHTHTHALRSISHPNSRHNINHTHSVMHQNSRVCHIWSRQTQKPTTTNHQIGTNHSTIWANDKLDWARNENKTTKTNCGSCVTVPNQITPTLTYTFCRNVVCIFKAREKKSIQAPRHFRPSERENVHWFFQLARTMTRLNCWAIRCTFAGAACALDARAFHIQHSPLLCSVAPPFDTSLSRCVAMAHTGLSYSLTLAVFVECRARSLLLDSEHMRICAARFAFRTTRYLIGFVVSGNTTTAAASATSASSNKKNIVQKNKCLCNRNGHSLYFYPYFHIQMLSYFMSYNMTSLCCDGCSHYPLCAPIIVFYIIYLLVDAAVVVYLIPFEYYQIAI